MEKQVGQRIEFWHRLYDRTCGITWRYEIGTDRIIADYTITALKKRELSGAQFEANVALDDIYAAVQRIRDLVNRADTHRKTAWDKSLWSRENDMRSATSRLRDATKIIRKLLFPVHKPRSR
jgi:hypothetical protein